MHRIIRGKYFFQVLKQFLANFLSILDIVQSDVKENRDLGHLNNVLDRQSLVHEHRQDQERRQSKLDDHRQSEEAFREVRPTNTEEVLVLEFGGIDRLHLATEEAHDAGTAHLLLDQIAPVELHRLTIATIVDRSHQHSVAKWILLSDTNPIPPLAIRSWKGSSTCKKSFISRNGTTRFHRLLNDPILMIEFIECSLIHQQTMLPRTHRTHTNPTAIHILKTIRMECSVQICIKSTFIRCRHHHFTFNRHALFSP